ncbi:MAG: hypothetical protein PWQ20_604 [Thermotogaceae bacterium]|jgi:uncharacterized protein YqgV (UPF0045/DUF77 family)|nr:hypothetical protein [Thermotogaceae bacterium]MDN5337534.1 hypothetical protein [Thermotogaceae bacterium]
MAITMSIQLLPLVKNDKELYEIIDNAIEIIGSSGLKFEVNAHSTIVEGDFERLLEIVKKIKENTLKVSKRFVLNVQFDVSEKGVTIDEKTKKYR